MTMKPEYNYGFKKAFNIEVYGKPSRFESLAKIILWIFIRKWVDHFHATHFFNAISEEELEAVKPELEKAHAYRVCIDHRYKVFRDDLLSISRMDVQFSRELSKLKEYSFEKWARNEQIQEAYRLTILPSFSAARVIRIWKKDDVTHLLYKIGYRWDLCEPQVKREKKKLLKTEKWQEIREFMNEHFWTSETWYSIPSGAIMLDGVVFLFEGWHDGKYKLLDDHSPNRGTMQSQAVKLFEFLVLSRIQQHSYRRIYD
mgnify:CR=1 FL=1